MKPMKYLIAILLFAFSFDTVAQTIAPNYVVVNNIAALKLRRGFNGQRASTLGYNAVGDGGHANYIWVDTSTVTSNDISYIKPTGLVGNGAWIIDAPGNLIHVRQMGIKGDNSAEGPIIRTSFATVTSAGYGIRGEKSTLNLNGDSVKTTSLLRLYSETPDFVIRNGKYIVPRAGLRMDGVTIKEFTAGAFVVDTLNGGINKSISKFLTYKVYNSYFEDNQYDFREATGAGKRDSTAATGTVLYQSEFIGNTFKNSKFASFNLDMLYNSVIIKGNIWEGTGNPAVYNYTLNIGMDGRANAYKETGLVIQGNTFRNIVHSQDVGGSFYGILARGKGMVFSNNTVQNMGGPIYLGGDFIAANNYIAQDSQYVKYAIIAKDCPIDATAKVLYNTISGFYGSGIYIESDVKNLNIVGNTIRLDQKDINVGQACVRVIGGDDNMKILNISGNHLYNNQTDNATNAIFITTSGSIETVSITGNTIDSKTVGISAKLINNCTRMIVRGNDYIRSVSTSTLGAKNLFIDGNNFVHLANWINLYGKEQALISNNWISPDSSLVGSSPATLSRMFNVETDDSTKNCEYTLLHNIVDQRKLTNMIRLEDSVKSVSVIGDRVINGVASASSAYVNSVTNAPLTMNILIENFHNPFDAQVFASSTASQTLNITIRNSTFGRDAIINLTGTSQVYNTLTVDNCVFPTNINVSQVFTNYDYIAKRGLNKRVVGTGSYTLIGTDVIKGKSNVIEAGLSSAITITIPPKSSVNLPAGTELMIWQTGNGAVTVAPGAGVTIVSPNGLTTAGLNQVIRLEKVTEPDGWRAVVIGGATSSGVADNWGTQVVEHDNTLTGNGTSGSLLKVDTFKIATLYDLASQDTIYFSSDTYKGFTGTGTSASPIMSKANVQTAETSSTDNQLTVFSGTGGRTIKKYTASGFPKLTNGVPVTQATINLTTDISGLLPIANGGTNANNRNSALNNLLPIQSAASSGMQLTSNGTDASWGEPGGYSVFSGITNTSTAAQMGIIPITASTAGLIDWYIIARHTIDLNQVEVSVYRYTSSYTKNSNGTLTLNYSTSFYNYNTLGYNPLFTIATDLSTQGIKVSAASQSTEQTEWTFYYKIWPNVLNQ
jgi:hypothetical protein